MRRSSIEAPRAAHFLMKLMFCMFAEDIGLLPPKLFSRVLEGAKNDPPRLAAKLAALFQAMTKGGDFGADTIPFFNGGLFNDAEVVELRLDEMKKLLEVNEHDWGSVEPSVFGTLFERTLDPSKRSQIGAHYTSRDDIMTLLGPVVMEPLRREWDQVRAKVDELWEKIRSTSPRAATAKDSKPRRDHDRLLRNFVERLAHVTILDPACGSGNFLYVAINLLLDVEKEVITYAASHGTSLLPQVRPTQLAGIEINPYAQQLAQVVIWIGYLQWMHDNGFNPPRDPVLEPIESILLMDAILDLSDPEHLTEPEWPSADFIVGNPPFLGNKRMRSELGANYCEALWALYHDRIPAMSDLCCYWFEKANHAIQNGRASRAGLLATTGITQVGSRHVLERICDTAKIVFAVSDRDWILDGAAVRISMVGFGPPSEAGPAILDGKSCPQIHADLTSGLDLTRAPRLAQNAGMCFMGTTKVGDFDISGERAADFLSKPNPNGQPNSDVVRPWRNGSDIVRVCAHKWIIDFGVAMPTDQASLYETPFQWLTEHVQAFRSTNGRQAYRDRWWIHGEARPGFREAVGGLPRYIATARVAKHRIFVWLDTVVIPDSKVIAIAFADDFRLGVLHSRVHELWTLATCGWHGLGNDATYNPTACFETFAFPEPDATSQAAVAAAAAELDRLRQAWLSPPEWTREQVLEFPGAVAGPWGRFVHAPNNRGIGTVRYTRLIPQHQEFAKELTKRTLTNLYNQRPAWLDAAHRRLDEAVFAAYGWRPDLSDDGILAKLLELNLQRESTD